MLKKILNNSFNRNVIVLFTGTTIAQAIPIAISPIVTRLYTPSEFGIFALFFSITNLLAVLATARYELAIVLPHSEEEADSIERLCFTIAFGFSIALLFVVFFFKTTIAELLGRPEIANWLYAVPFSVFFTGVIQSLTYRLNRNKGFKEMTYLKLTQTSVTGGASIAFGISRLMGGLIVSLILGQIASIVLQHLKKKIIFSRWSDLRTVAKKYRNFAIGTPAALLNTAATSLPLFLISKIAEKKEVGFYGLVERSISAPISLVSYSVSQVLLEEIATRHRQGLPIKDKILHLTKMLFLIGVLPFGALCIFSSKIFEVVFGAQWIQAGHYASILSVAFFARFIVSPLSSVFVSTNKLQRLVLWQIIYFCSTLAISTYSYFYSGIDEFLILLLTNDLLMYSFHFYLILRLSKKDSTH
ncbi:MAG: oligosaccharide flippase family protein [Bacteroidetes bacterium]|nr:oligosaccharide flippase family protein [Bacteroidota bacterium]